MDLRTHSDGPLLTVRLSDDVLPDVAADTEVDQAITRVLAESRATRLLLDFSDVNMFNSLGIAALIQVHKHCRVAGVAMAVCELSDDVAKVFRVTALHRLLAVHGTAAEARAALESGAAP